MIRSCLQATPSFPDSLPYWLIPVGRDMPARFIFAMLTALNRPFSHDAGRDGFKRVNACASRAFIRGVRRVNALSQKGLICVARTHRRAFPPRETELAGGSRINFAAPASKKTRPRVGLFGGLQPSTPSRVARDGVLPLTLGVLAWRSAATLPPCDRQ